MLLVFLTASLIVAALVPKQELKGTGREQCANVERLPCPGYPEDTCRGDIHMMWALGLRRSSHIFSTNNISGPVQTGADVKGVQALFVADPFLVIDKEDTWYIFTEVLNNACQRGEVGYHVSLDAGRSWSFGSIVMAESWHLSFPFVIFEQGKYYMTTCATAGYGNSKPLWLYSTENFPTGWKRHTELIGQGQLVGQAIDPVLKLHNSVWFLFVLDNGIDKERLFFSKDLFGPYQEHPRSGRYAIRQSGQIVVDESGHLWAFHHTSETVERWLITTLTPTEYEYGEHLPLLSKGEVKWKSSGMHTYNAVKLNDNTWASVVDGWWNDDSHSVYQCLREGGRVCQERGKAAE